MNIESADIIRLIEQFLKEHNLHKTLDTLQSESGVTLNTVDSVDSFKGDIALVQSLDSAEDKMPEKPLTTVKFPKKQHPNALAFSVKGSYLASGSGDGFVEVWNFMTGKLAADLSYQAEGSPMMMDGAITSLAFSHSGDLICSGAKDGKMKVWKLKSGSSYKRFPAAHSGDVTCVCFSDDDSQILSGGIDGILRIHGLKSGSMLKEFHGHSAAATAAVFAGNMRFVASTSEDGHVRIWDASTAACLHDIIPGTDAGGLITPSAHSVMVVPGRPGSFIVCTRSLTMHMFSTSGRLEKTFAVSGKVECNEFLAAAVMSKGKYVLAVSDKSVLYCFDIETGSALEVSYKVGNTEIIGMAAHPSLNVAAFFADDRYIPIWTSR
ncbi:Serine/threonine-protein kinase smu1 [Coemansia erecta]|uniref:WD40 repeat-containing protein SMU1 n=1 Tax=Coemansia erecta TaxID=147472 RepID=A0A9W8CU15_9FUNG|nr:Serine/threonine-protein kinase smu1 [Coemansia erecta]